MRGKLSQKAGSIAAMSSPGYVLTGERAVLAARRGAAVSPMLERLR
jgi:hypothetical protein